MTRFVLLIALASTVGVWSHNMPADKPMEQETKTMNNDVDELETLRREKMRLLEEIDLLQETNNNLRFDNVALGKQRQVEEPAIALQFNRNNLTGLRPADCSDLLMLGAKRSGVYNIYPFTCACSSPMRVYCDMETDGGGWTVFMTRQRQPVQLNFNRTWEDYKKGFGRLNEEHWLGNDNIHVLTASRSYSLRMDVETTNGDAKSSVYTTFKMENEDKKYQLVLSTTSPENTLPFDCFLGLKNRFFTTYDKDFDSKTDANCAAVTGGGFWHVACNHQPPTGVYEGGVNTTCYRTLYKMSRIQMKIRPTICGSISRTIKLATANCGDCGGHQFAQPLVAA